MCSDRLRIHAVEEAVVACLVQHFGRSVSDELQGTEGRVIDAAGIFCVYRVLIRRLRSAQF